MTVKVQANQTLIDIAMQCMGDASFVFAVAAANGLEVTADLVPGTILQVPEAGLDKKKTVEYFNMQGNQPASLLSGEVGGVETDEGIDFWYVEDDFVIQ